MKYFHGADERAAHIVPPYYCKKATRIPYTVCWPLPYTLSVFLSDCASSFSRQIAFRRETYFFLVLRSCIFTSQDRFVSFSSLRTPFTFFFFFSSIRVWHDIPVNIYDRIFVLNWSLYWKFKKFRTAYQKVYGPFQSIFRNYNSCVLHITI